MNLVNDPMPLLGGAQGSLAFCGLDTHWFQVSHCPLFLASVSDGTCFCDSTGDLGEQKKVSNEATGQVTDSESAEALLHLAA